MTAVAPIVGAHHERLDAKGYPDQVAGEEIPLEARVIAACDAYDAMANTRHYREGFGRDRAVAILRERAGSQWDARVVAAVVEVTADEATGVFAHVGYGENQDQPGTVACRSIDALPESTQGILV